MQLRQRLRKIELTLRPTFRLSEWKRCEHPENAINFYRVAPVRDFPDRRLVTKFHCQKCGFQDHLWRKNLLTKEQEAYFYYVRDTDFHAGLDLEEEATKAGALVYFLWEDYEQEKDTNAFKELLYCHLHGTVAEINAMQSKEFFEQCFGGK